MTSRLGPVPTYIRIVYTIAFGAKQLFKTYSSLVHLNEMEAGSSRVGVDAMNFINCFLFLIPSKNLLSMGDVGGTLN